ncbi:MAG: N-6 DNA methylase, partial [Streptosporangiaceae bacterium]
MTIGETRTASLADDGPLMSMPEIAELAGVRRPVVTTWRRRHPDFPAPVTGNAARPLFDARQVAGWLVATGRAARDQIEPEQALHALTAMCARRPASEPLPLLTALICLRHLDDDEPLATEPLADGSAALAARAARADPGDQLLLSEISAQLADAVALRETVDDLVEAAWGCAGAFEHVVRFAHRLGAASLHSAAVTPELARLIAEVSGARDLARSGGPLLVTDPAAGSGDLLLAVSHLLGPDDRPAISGAERSPELARLARRRLAVQGIPLANIDIVAGAELPEDTADPDVIATQIPYVPGEARRAADVLAAVADIAVRVAPGRTAVVLGPADVLVAALPPFSDAERARAQLLTGGMVEAVIRLPGGVLPFRPGYEAALWVLTSAYHSRWAGRVLLADVSDRQLTAPVAAALADDIITWRRDGYDPAAHERAFGVQVAVSDLVDPPLPLTVRRPPGIREIMTSIP